MWLEEFDYNKNDFSIDDWENGNLIECIFKEVLKEFKTLHFSGNLTDTMKLDYSPVKKEFKLFIKAPVYDIAYYKETGIIIPPKNKTTNNKKTWKSKNVVKHGSYAEQVNTYGGFSHKHTDYVSRCIKRGYDEWKKNQPKNLQITMNPK